MQDIYWVAEGQTLQLQSQDGPVGAVIPGETPGIRCEDKVEAVAEGVFRWTRIFNVHPFVVRKINKLKMEFTSFYSPRYWMIPAVSYNGNSWGDGLEPKGFGSEDGAPWTYAWHRSSLPGATYSEGPVWSVGIVGDIEKNPPFSCSLQIKCGRALHTLSIPEEESPAVYCARDSYDQNAFLDTITTRNGLRFEMACYLIISRVEKPRAAWRSMLDWAWRFGWHKVQPWFDHRKIWDYGIEFIKNSMWYETDIFAGFCMGLFWEADRWTQKVDWLEIGWVGQNASLALSLIYDYKYTGNQDSLTRGLKALDCWAAHASLENGLFRCRFDRITADRDWSNKTEVQDAANLATVVFQYFDAWSVLRGLGIARENYRDIAVGICNFAVNVQRPDGAFGKSWWNDGSCRDPEGTIGAYLAMALCKGYEVTGDGRYLAAAQKGFDFYIGALEKEGYTTAGALDTDCIDKESSMPLLRSGIMLFEFTGETSYLERAELAAWYLASWQYHYSIKFPSESILGRLGYDSFGGTAVSTQHQHIDSYALYFFADWLKLADYTQNRVWRERAMAVWANGTAMISDGSLVIDGKLRPLGSQDEGICQTRWHTRYGSYFGVSQWLVCWTTAFRLEILRDDGLRKQIADYWSD